jgi:nitrogen regulatory protein P-II 2
MKLVTIIIKPFKLDEVREALTDINVGGLTMTTVEGFGRQKGLTELYQPGDNETYLLPKIKLEIAVNDEILDLVIDTVSRHAYTGKIGDGKIFVSPLEKVYRIRTGEQDQEAI